MKKTFIVMVAFIFAIFFLSLDLFAQSTSTIVYVTKTGEKYHAAGCKSLAKSSIPISLGEAAKRYSPCSICNPPRLTSNRVPTPAEPTPTPPSVSTPTAIFSGKVVAITDGDTIGVLRDGKEVKIRLNGIDAPESSQAFGQKAKQLCSDLCFGKAVEVRVQDVDRYSRLVADIILPSGLVLNRELVAAGMAWHYKAYSKDATLAALEISARENRIGLWSDPQPIAPWEWRR